MIKFPNIGLPTLFILGTVVAILIKVLFTENFLTILSKIEVARGLITSLVSIGVIGIAIAIVVANYTDNNSNEEISEKKHNRGKDILSVLVGILGTIVGYYFGSTNSTNTTIPSSLVAPLSSTPTPALGSPSPTPTLGSPSPTPASLKSSPSPTPTAASGSPSPTPPSSKSSP
jgi:hypothetical protein